MTEKQALAFKDLFYRIKQFYYGASDHPFSSAHRSSGDAAEYIAALKEAEENLSLPEAGRPLADDAAEMFSYTARLTREALADGNIRLAGDAAALGVQLVGVYTFPCMKRQRFWKKCVLPFREKHSEDLFAEVEADFLSRRSATLWLRPSFSHGEGYYYDDDADESLRSSHPVVYALFILLGILLFLGSVTLFGLVSGLGLHITSFWMILGYAGAAALGVGLYSFAMTFIRQYMGHLLTISLSVCGVLAIVFSFVLHFVFAA